MHLPSVDGDRVIGGVSSDAHERALDCGEQIEGGGRILPCPSRIRCQAATGSWTKSRQWQTERTLFSSARATMCPLAKVNGVWPFNDAWLRTSLEEVRRQAPRNVVSILDSAKELGIRDAQDPR